MIPLIKSLLIKMNEKNNKNEFSINSNQKYLFRDLEKIKFLIKY